MNRQRILDAFSNSNAEKIVRWSEYDGHRAWTATHQLRVIDISLAATISAQQREMYRNHITWRCENARLNFIRQPKRRDHRRVMLWLPCRKEAECRRQWTGDATGFAQISLRDAPGDRPA